MRMDKILLKHKPPVCDVCRRQLYVAAALNCWYLLMRHDEAQRAERFLASCRFAGFVFRFCFFFFAFFLFESNDSLSHRWHI